MKRVGGRAFKIGGARGASCADLLAVINEYVDGQADPALCRELQKHLATCNPCRVVVDNLRQTITLYREHKPCRLPAGFHKRLHKALLACWKSRAPVARRAVARGKKPRSTDSP
jgi:anti-sigma factor RsiW